MCFARTVTYRNTIILESQHAPDWAGTAVRLQLRGAPSAKLQPNSPSLLLPDREIRRTDGSERIYFWLGLMKEWDWFQGCKYRMQSAGVVTGRACRPGRPNPER